MLKIFILIALFLSGCTTVYEPVPVATPAPPAKSGYVKELERFRAEVSEAKRYADVDKGVQTLQNCQSLFARGSDGERLCLLRGFDRYVDHMTPPVGERYLRRDDEISVKIPRPEPAPVSPPPVARQVPNHPSALVDCRVDPRPPCRHAEPMPEPWQYGGQASPPGRP